MTSCVAAAWWRGRLFARAATLIAVLGLSAALGACVYVHDDDLQTRTAAADTAARAHPIDAVFTAELSQLSDQDKNEALAVARYMVAVRDWRLGAAVEPEDPAARAGKLRGIIATRQADLFIGSTPDLVKLIDFPSALEDYRDKLAERLLSYETYKSNYSGPQTDLSCKAIRALAQDPLTTPLGRMQKACKEMVGGDLLPSFGDQPGPVAQDALKGLAEAEADLNPEEAEPVNAKIEALIDAAAKAAPSNAKAVDDARDALSKILQGASAAAQLAAWTKLDGILGDVLLGAGCAQATPDATKCGSVTPPTTAGRARAVWTLASAIATLADANADQGRSGFALQAAKAIAAANKADAQARADAAKTLVAVRLRRVIALATETRYLVEAEQELNTDPRHCGAKAPDCAIALYGLSWDRGRIPFTLTLFSEDALTRETWVARTRIAANAQEAVLTASTSSLRAYGAGGIKPELPAQLLNAAALTAVAASH